MKFFIMLFVIVGPSQMKMAGEKEVPTMEACIAEAYEINVSNSIMYNAACVPLKKDML
jgi:hypothetical protein